MTCTEITLEVFFFFETSRESRPTTQHYNPEDLISKIVSVFKIVSVTNQAFSCVRLKDPNFVQADVHKLHVAYKNALQPMFVCFELLQMTRYKQADFAEDDSSSVGSVQLTEGISATTTHIRYHTVSADKKLLTVRN
jgi:hypothetical protein